MFVSCGAVMPTRVVWLIDSDRAPELDRETRAPGRLPVAFHLQIRAVRGGRELGAAVAPFRAGEADRADDAERGAAGDLVRDRAVGHRVEPPVAPGPRPPDRVGVTRVEVQGRGDQDRGREEVRRPDDRLDVAGPRVDFEGLVRPQETGPLGDAPRTSVSAATTLPWKTVARVLPSAPMFSPNSVPRSSTAEPGPETTNRSTPAGTRTRNRPRWQSALLVIGDQLHVRRPFPRRSRRR